MHKWKIPLYVLLIQRLVVLPVTVFVAVFFLGITWGASVAIAPILIPFLSMLFMVIIYGFSTSSVWRQGLREGLLLTLVFWVLAWIVASQIPSVRKWVPPLRTRDFERNAGRVAYATRSKLNWVNGDKAELVTATGETLTLQDGVNGVCFNWWIPEGSFPKESRKAVLTFIADKGLVFLNAEGQRAFLYAIRAKQVNTYGSAYLEMRVGEKDAELLTCNPGDHNIRICIKKEYLMMDMIKRY